MNSIRQIEALKVSKLLKYLKFEFQNFKVLKSKTMEVNDRCCLPGGPVGEKSGKRRLAFDL